MTSAQDMVRIFKEAMAKNVGVSSISVDGQTMNFHSPSDLQKQLEFWERRAAAETAIVTGKKRRRLFKGNDLGSAF